MQLKKTKVIFFIAVMLVDVRNLGYALVRNLFEVVA